VVHIDSNSDDKKEFGMRIVFKRIFVFLLATTMLLCVSLEANASNIYVEIEKES